ncbi:hypothetical protein DWV84_25165 [Blautia sp. AF13-16]|nr:hypothetical protein C3R19_16630 [Blautia producta]RHP74208.1 hypothetical protein DXA40_27000 [Blautia sp. OF01-4LB]RHS10611.1 hypothetical protein DWV84_25165 [Blautia sp. AF13-16]
MERGNGHESLNQERKRSVCGCEKAAFRILPSPTDVKPAGDNFHAPCLGENVLTEPWKRTYTCVGFY